MDQSANFQVIIRKKYGVPVQISAISCDLGDKVPVSVDMNKNPDTGEWKNPKISGPEFSSSPYYQIGEFIETLKAAQIIANYLTMHGRNDNLPFADYTWIYPKYNEVGCLIQEFDFWGYSH